MSVTHNENRTKRRRNAKLLQNFTKVDSNVDQETRSSVNALNA